jgi:hypothetical protein
MGASIFWEQEGRGPMSELRKYAVDGFVPRARLTDEECQGVRSNAPGAWVRIGTFLAWGPRSAVEKALRQAWSREDRASKFRATRVETRAVRREPSALRRDWTPRESHG